MSHTTLGTTELLNLRPIPGIGPKNIYRGRAPEILRAIHADQLQQLNVRTLIDLREPAEVQRETLLADFSVRYRPIPLYCGQDPAERTLSENQRLLLDGRGARLVAALRAVGQEPTGATVLLCGTGEKRTGLVVALLLAVLVVDRELIIQDYARTVFEREPDAANAAARTLSHTLDWLLESYGSVAGYLLSKGLSAAELHKLQQLRAQTRRELNRPLVAS